MNPDLAYIVIVCDSPDHPARRTEIVIGSARRGGTGWIFSGQGVYDQLINVEDNGPLLTRAARVRGMKGFRDRYVLECRKCKKPVPVRGDRLIPALDEAARLGVPRLRLRDLSR